MSEKKPNNPPAFPMSAYKAYGNNPGMTLRDYFAAKALSGFDISIWRSAEETANVAKLAYKIADAMLEEREKYDKESPTT